MFYQIVSFLLEVVVSLIGGACLLRLYMQYQRVPFANPVGRFVFAVTDWLVLPLRRMVPGRGAWDLASLVAAYLIKLSQFVLLGLLAGGLTMLVWVPVLALFGLVQMAIAGMTGLLIVYAVLSWTQPGSALALVINRLCEPLLGPIRQIIPLVGGVDLSPLVLLVALQVAAMLLASVQQIVLR
jgi:YggT family protein